MKEERIKIKSASGLSISTIVNFPENDLSKLAILCHGFFDTKDYLHLSNFAQQLSENGYTVYRFDAIGTWESEGGASAFSTTEYLSNIKSVIDFATENKTYLEILLGGHSRGGQVSILYTPTDARVTKVLAIMPSTSRTITGPRYESWERDGYHIAKRDNPFSLEEKVEFKIPYAEVLDRKQYNALDSVKKICVPILFVVGKDDDIVLPEFVEELYSNADLSIRKKIMYLEGVGHDYRKREDVGAINKLIIENLNLLA
jgi:alpha-beta hydrolase superfamily lysophospholipase